MENAGASNTVSVVAPVTEQPVTTVATATETAGTTVAAQAAQTSSLGKVLGAYSAVEPGPRRRQACWYICRW